MGDSSFIDAFYTRHLEMHQYLLEQKEVSFASDLNTTFARSLVLAIASFFEHEVTEIVRQVPAVYAKGQPMIAAMIEKNVIARKYHTWFDWDARSAGPFLALFGSEYKSAVQARLKKGGSEYTAISAFLELGNIRNRLVHQNYVQFQVERTSEELHALFRDALPVLKFMRESLGVDTAVPPEDSADISADSKSDLATLFYGNGAD
ncbi:HEPN domain-containing protein [Paracoccus sp. SM22M-07]|uniref:HEPN domain-containing protein n=1 Tax=Paracoccus sp. SM22M-07 TaxID=1520813 RepID=UPI00090F606E|nr:HEPN domain-containing protein [Paracoccus sp. SM22M-07]OJH45036.1 hypothetical protein IE00_09615 [Paracoccus sp. SM22M-07]